MKKVILAATILGLTMGGALAQTSQPQGGANQSPTSPTNSMDRDGMKQNNTGAPATTGMSNDTMKKDGMQKGTTGTNPANGSSGASGGEGGSGR